MSDDRVPIPIQAFLGAFVPGLATAASAVAWAVATFAEPQGTTRTALLLVPLTILLTGAFFQHRFIRRAIVVGMLDASASPRLVTVFTGVASVIGALVMHYVEDAPPGVRTQWHSGNGSFSGFLAMATVWVAACAALVISRKRAR